MALAIPLVFFGAFFATCLSRFQNMSVNCVAFPIRGGSQLHLWFNRPDAGTFDAFCDALAKAAEHAWRNRPIESPGLGLADQIRELQKLRESKILSDEEFERAKRKLIGPSPADRIGF